MYKKIRKKSSVLTLYSQKLVREGVASQELVDKLKKETQEKLEFAFAESKKADQNFSPDIPLAVSKEDLIEFQPTGGTSVDMNLLRVVAGALTTLPENFHLHPTRIHSW